MKSLKYFYLIAIILIAKSAVSQQEDVPKYFQTVYQCEIQICKRNYAEAVKNYERLINYKFLVKFSDIRNYLVCSILSNNEKAIEKAINLLSEKQHFCRQVDTLERWHKLLPDNEKNKIRRSFIQSTVTANKFEAIIDSLFDKDQAARHACSGYAPQCVNKVIEVDRKNMEDIKTLLLDKDFRYEHSVSNDHIQCLFVMLTHWRQWGFAGYDSILLSATKQGYYSPFFYAQMVDYRPSDDSIKKMLPTNIFYGEGFKNFLVNDTLLCFKLSKDSADMINKNRLSINYFDIETEKILYEGKYDHNFFSSRDLRIVPMRWQMSPQELAELIKNLKAKNVLE